MNKLTKVLTTMTIMLSFTSFATETLEPPPVEQQAPTLEWEWLEQVGVPCDPYPQCA